MLISLVALAIAASSGPDGVIATAPTTSAPPMTAEAVASPEAPRTTVQSAAAQNLTTDQQIARWIDRRSPAQTFTEAEDWAPRDDRKMHGEVDAAVGTDGYRDVSAWVSIPVGSSGRVDLAYRHTENGLYPTWRDPREFDVYYGGSSTLPSVLEQRGHDDAWGDHPRRRRPFAPDVTARD